MHKNKQVINSAEPRFRPWDILYFVIWFGVLSGLTGIALLRMKGLVGGGAVYLLRCHTMWMSPAANVVVLGVVGFATLPLLMRLSRTMAIRISFVVLASVFFVSVLVLELAFLSQINFVAKVILSVGLAVALQRLIARRALGFERFVRRTTVDLVLLVLILTVAVGGWQHFQERRIIASLPDSLPSASNVLLIVLDTVRAESMGLYGYERSTTPYLMELAKESTVFQSAIATSSWTLPTHVSLFTGQFHHKTHTGIGNPLDATYPTLSEALISQGYMTGGFVANYWFCQREYGLARGFIHYEDYVASAGEFTRSSSLMWFAFGQGETSWFSRLLGCYERLDRKHASRITNDFLRWVDHIPSGRPFFAFLNYFDSHAPWLPPADFAQKFGCSDNLDTYRRTLYGRVEPWLPSNMTTEEIESMRNAYDGSIAYLDYNMKVLLDELKQRELLDRTLVILVSDHGEELGEHSTLGHGIDLHMKSIRVPLILRLPGIVPGDVTVQEPVTLRDIPATVMDLLGLPDDGLFPGQSLGRYWIEPGREELENSEVILSEISRIPWAVGTPSEKGDMKSLVTGDMHYIRNGDGSEEVYDLRHDPVEHNDLIQTPRGADAAAQARRILEGILH